MPDYGEMQNALQTLNERALSVVGVECPNGSCFGTLRRLDGEVVCTGGAH